MKIKILVSGIGGDIGFGVGRILRSLDFVTQVFGIDIHDNHPGSTLFDKCAVCPKASNDDYLSWLNSFILNNKVDFFIPSSEAEIKALTDLGKEEIAGAKVLMSNKFMVEKCLDKNQCLRFLKSKDIQVPLNGLVGIDTPDDYPVIVKPNYGRGSQGLKKIESNTMFKTFVESCPGDFVWQQYLYPDTEEYTCALFKVNGINLRSLIIKRELSGGFTSKGEVVENVEIDNYINKIGESMKLDGVMNIQLRLTDKGPLLFEINPRLSSTLVFRDKLGFKDLEWWLLSHLDKKLSAYRKPKAGQLFYRGVSEYIL